MHLAKKKSTNLLDYAVPVSPELYANSSEYASRLKPKIHKHSQVADDACIQYQIDFIGREHIGKFAGSLNPICGSVIALAFPYTLPENLALVAYMCESGAVADGMSFVLQGKLHLSRILKIDDRYRRGLFGFGEFDIHCVRLSRNKHV